MIIRKTRSLRLMTFTLLLIHFNPAARRIRERKTGGPPTLGLDQWIHHSTHPTLG